MLNESKEISRASRLKVDHTKSYYMIKNLGDTYPRGGADLREGAHQNLDSQRGR